MGFRGVAPRQLASKLRSSLSEPEAAAVALGPLRTRGGGEWLTDHADVELVSLLADEPEHAAWFVQDQLGRLAGDDPRTAALRETLRAYLRFG
jgi:DNA-binding PucR family transcriptional regulator